MHSGHGNGNTNKIIFPESIIDSPLPSDIFDNVNIVFNTLTMRLITLYTKLEDLLKTLQQQNPEYTTWKSNTTRELQADTDSDEPLDERLQKRYMVMLKQEWESAAADARKTDDDLTEFVELADALMDKIGDV